MKIQSVTFEPVQLRLREPLVTHGSRLRERLRQRLGPGVVVDAAMRYGEPSVESVLARMTGQGVDRIVVFPLFPQYSAATTGSTLEAVFYWAWRQWNVPSLVIVPPFSRPRQVPLTAGYLEEGSLQLRYVRVG